MFTRDTFRYFAEAKKHRKSKVWFEKNRALYDDNVLAPMQEFIGHLRQSLGKDLPSIVIDPKKVSQPFYRANRIPIDGSVVKIQSSLHFSERATSMFETNPGIYFSMGAGEEGNVMAVGLYMPSGRQLRMLREHLAKSPDVLSKILKAPKLRKSWGGLAGERFVRFPRGYDEIGPGAEYLWHKSFYLGRHPTKVEMMKSTFFKAAADDFKAALPFLRWARQVVGTYSGPGMRRER